MHCFCWNKEYVLINGNDDTFSLRIFTLWLYIDELLTNNNAQKPKDNVIF